MRRHLPYSLILSGLLACTGFVVRADAADTITLVSGVQMDGDIIVESETEVKFRVKGRVITFPRSAIGGIEYGPDSTAPSQVQEREDKSDEDLEKTKNRVRAIKIRTKRRPKRQEQQQEQEQPALSEIDTLEFPEEPTEEEKKLIAQLRNGPNKREAARKLGAIKALVAIPNLIRALDEKSPYLRGEAHKSLRTMTKKNFGYRAVERNRSVRLEAVKRWQKWYEKASGRRVPW